MTEGLPDTGGQADTPGAARKESVTGDWAAQRLTRADVDAVTVQRYRDRLCARFGGEPPAEAVAGLGDERGITYWGDERGPVAWARGESDATLDLVADATFRSFGADAATADADAARAASVTRAAVRKARSRLLGRRFA